MDLEQVLLVATRGGASDIILKTGQVPRFRHNGILVSLQDGKDIDKAMMQSWIDHMMPKHLKEQYQNTGDADFAYESTFGTRFRVNAFRQRGDMGLVLRIISGHIRTVEELQLPDICNKISGLKRGLVLVTGATGSGKSTTLAAVVQKINLEKAAHIITIEDPIEYIFKDSKSTINQREVGIDTDSFSVALRASLRQNPDVIFVGELRDKETTETALMAAETGHLVFSTLHTLDAVESLNRIMSYFPAAQHRAIKSQLAASLQVVLSQRLVQRADSRAMVPAIEIMVVNQYIRDLVNEGKNFDPIYDAIAKGGQAYGMKSFDQALLDLMNRGVISKEEALRNATSSAAFELLLSGVNN